MKKWWIVVAIVCLGFAAQAADKNVKAKNEEKAAMPLREKVIAVPEKECAYLTANDASADAEYKPGVDVKGKPVKEADLEPAVITPPEKYSIDINYDTGKRLGLDIPNVPDWVNMQGTIIKLDVNKGVVTYNGKSLQGGEAGLKAICAEQAAKKAAEEAKEEASKATKAVDPE